MNTPWIIANLEDARQALAYAISEIKTLETADHCIAQDLIAEVYIKLNYAWNSRTGPGDSLEDGRYDERIKYPKEMDIYTEKGRTAVALAMLCREPGNPVSCARGRPPDGCNGLRAIRRV